MVNLRDSGMVDFIGVGMIKSGSTWIGKILSEHPEILFARRTSSKEIKYFNRPYNLSKGLSWYLRQFPPARPGKIRGEFTPGYMLDESTAEIIAAHFPSVKILVVLRNPVDMLYSYHQDRLASPWYDVNESFEAQVLAGSLSPLEIAIGDYATKLAPYYTIFPRQNIFVTLLDDIVADPCQVSTRLYEFLGISEKFIPPSLYLRVNDRVEVRSEKVHAFFKHVIRSTRRTSIVKSMEHSPRWNEIIYHGYRFVNCRHASPKPLSLAVRQALLAYYNESNCRLGDLIDRDLSIWNG